MLSVFVYAYKVTDRKPKGAGGGGRTDAVIGLLSLLVWRGIILDTRADLDALRSCFRPGRSVDSLPCRLDQQHDGTCYSAGTDPESP